MARTRYAWKLSGDGSRDHRRQRCQGSIIESNVTRRSRPGSVACRAPPPAKANAKAGVPVLDGLERVGERGGVNVAIRAAIVCPDALRDVDALAANGSLGWWVREVLAAERAAWISEERIDESLLGALQQVAKQVLSGVRKGQTLGVDLERRVEIVGAL